MARLHESRWLPGIFAGALALVLSGCDGGNGAAAPAPPSEPVPPPGRTFNVNTTADTPAAAPGDGACADTAGECSLRAAVMEANEVCHWLEQGSPVCTINIPAGTYALTRAAAIGEEGAGAGALDIIGRVRLFGAGQENTVIDGNGPTVRESVFRLGLGTEAHIRGVTIRNGNPSGVESHGTLELEEVTLREHRDYGLQHRGGRLTVLGTLIEANEGGGAEIFTVSDHDALIEDSVIRDNRGDWGAGLNLSGSVTIRNTTVSGNAATAGDFSRGGGLYVRGDVRLIGSTVEENSARMEGGGIANAGTLDILNSTISGNSVSGSLSLPLQGGGIHNSETLRLSFVTIAGNTTANTAGDARGAGLHTSSSTITLKATILSGNSGGEWGDCFTEQAVQLQSQGYNLFGNITGCNVLFEGTDGVREARLGERGHNGGATRSHSPHRDSPARNAIPPAHCTDVHGEAVGVDQRGMARPQGPACTIGAVETD
jgi:CSLREA domain-containing protein